MLVVALRPVMIDSGFGHGAVLTRRLLAEAGVEPREFLPSFLAEMRRSGAVVAVHGVLTRPRRMMSFPRVVGAPARLAGANACRLTRQPRT